MISRGGRDLLRAIQAVPLSNHYIPHQILNIMYGDAANKLVISTVFVQIHIPIANRVHRW